MLKEQSPGKSTTRRYTPEDIRVPRSGWSCFAAYQLSTEHGTIQRVGGQLGYGWWRSGFVGFQADINEGHMPGVSTERRAEVEGARARKP
jgi:hypothetical protein